MIVPIQNSDVAEIFEKVADLLEIEGENRFRVRAYRDAAWTGSHHGKADQNLRGRADRPLP
jgi:DNA polymerase (family X)